MSARLFLLLCAATVPASFGLLQDGFFSSSDGMIHLYRLFELDHALHASILYPRWFPLSGYGYGLPVLNYYPPLAYYLAEFFHLFGAGYIASIKLLIVTGFIIAAVSMFLFTRDLLGTLPAIIASIAFVYFPYLLSDAYIRGNFSEFLAMSFIPLALYAFQRLFATRDLKFFPLATISFAAIILSHHLTAMLFAPLLAAYVLFLFILHRNWRNLSTCAMAMTATLTLSAFYWVPAIAELNLVFVDPASIPRFLVSRLVSASDFFAPSLAYTYLPQSDALLHSAGFPQTLVALLMAGVVVTLSAATLAPHASAGEGIANASQAIPDRVDTDRSKPQSPVSNLYTLFFFLVLIFSIFMMLNLSAPLWYAIPALRFMQFPWRFQVIAGISIAFLIGVAATQIERITNYQFRLVFYSFVPLGLIALAIVNLPVRPFSLTDAQLDLTHSNDPDYVAAQMGWSWTREFVPAGVHAESVIGHQVRLGPPESLGTIPSIQIENDAILSRTTRVSTQQPFELSLHTFFYPGWQAYLDNAPARTYPKGELGLATVNVPSGDHRVTLRFEETPFRMAMDVVSAFALIAGIVWLGIALRRVFTALAITLILLVAIFLAHPRVATAAPQPIALAANFENRALLIGYSTEPTKDAAYVTLYWLTLAEMDSDYMSFVHLIDLNGQIIAQDDSFTDQGITPTTRWQPGELVTDRHALSVKNIPRGDYRLIAGLYLPRENGYTSMLAFDRAGIKIGNQVELGKIQLTK